MSALELCAQQETESLKLACFEAIIAGGRRQAAETAIGAEAAPPASVAPGDAVVAEPAADGVPAAAAALAPGAAAAPAGAPARREPAAAAVSAAPPTLREAPPAPPAAARVQQEPPPAAASVTEVTDRLGQEHLDRRGNDDGIDGQVFHATVTEVSEGRNKILYFHFANGQVWRQLEARHVSYPKDGEFEITITRGMMGDYRMRIGDNGRMVRILRLE